MIATSAATATLLGSSSALAFFDSVNVNASTSVSSTQTVNGGAFSNTTITQVGGAFSNQTARNRSRTRNTTSATQTTNAINVISISQ